MTTKVYFRHREQTNYEQLLTKQQEIITTDNVTRLTLY